jgi:hypothetical protein
VSPSIVLHTSLIYANVKGFSAAEAVIMWYHKQLLDNVTGSVASSNMFSFFLLSLFLNLSLVVDFDYGYLVIT